MTWWIRPAIVAALDMIKSRRGRTISMLLQFTVGFAALGILSAVILQSQFTAGLLLTTFDPPDVLGLYPAVESSGSAGQSPGGTGVLASGGRALITARNVTELESIPGVRAVAILWRSEAVLPDGTRMDIYAVNEAYERLAGLTLSNLAPDAPERIAGAGPGWVFLTEEAKKRLEPEGAAGGPGLSGIRYTILGRVVSARVAGIVSPRAAWPPPPEPSGLVDFDLAPAALVVDVEAVGERAWFDNAVWLQLEPEADMTAVESGLEAWPALHGRPGLALKGVSVREEISRQAASRKPVAWIAGLLSTLLLAMSALGLAGQTMLAADMRRSEWALRLALGATRAQVMLQSALETSLAVLAAAMLGLMIAAVVSPLVTEGRLRVGDWFGLGLLCTIAGALLVSALTAVYPVRKVSREDPTGILKESW